MNPDLFSAYSPIALWSPIWAVIVILAGVFYIRKLKATQNHSVSRGKKTMFLIALFLIYGVVGSPFHVIAADDLFSAYLLQLSVLYLVVPPFLILGTPLVWLKPLLLRRSFKNILQLLTYPWVTAILFNIGLSIYLLPSVFQPIHAHPLFEISTRVVLFLAAVFMWGSVLSPVRELNPLSEMQRVFYVFITAIMLTPIAMVLLFSGHVLYPLYAETTQVVPGLSAIYDQQIGAAILKLFQLTAFGITLGTLVYKWMKKEEQQTPPAKVIPFPVKDNTK